MRTIVYFYPIKRNNLTMKIFVSIILLLSISLNGYMAWQSKKQKEDLNQMIIENRILFFKNIELVRRMNGDSIPHFSQNN